MDTLYRVEVKPYGDTGHTFLIYDKSTEELTGSIVYDLEEDCYDSHETSVESWITELLVFTKQREREIASYLIELAVNRAKMDGRCRIFVLDFSKECKQPELRDTFILNGFVPFAHKSYSQLLVRNLENK